MTNFEFYSTILLEDIEHYESVDNMDSMEIFKEIFKKGSYCVFTENDQTYLGKFVKWLKQEYVKPFAITQVEKDILENLKVKYEFIENRGCGNIMVADSSGFGGNIGNFFEVRFSCLELNKKYRVEEILSNCEVVLDIDF